MLRNIRRMWLLALGGLGFMLGCEAGGPPNILLVVVDTLRADRLGCYGDARRLTPAFDAWARKGTLFERAYAQSSWTNPSVASLMTSRYQSQHGVLVLYSVLPDAELTLAEALRGQGYATAGFTANAAIGEDRGFAQGFDVYHSFPTTEPLADAYASATEVNAAALQWLSERASDGPVFLYLQYMEPHPPYHPSAEALGKLREEPLDLQKLNEIWYSRSPQKSMLPSIADARDAYAAEVIDVDARLATLVEQLDQRGFLDGAIVVVTSDHGEEFEEHGKRGHGTTLYEESVRVPLLVSGPSVVPGARVGTTVSLVDLAPTLFDLAGLPIPTSFSGNSLRSLLTQQRTGSNPTPGLALTELQAFPFDRTRTPLHQRSLITGDHKLITRHVDAGLEFYDLKADPGELDENALAEIDRASLREQLDAAVRSASADPSGRREAPLDERALDRLRMLGYVE